MLHENNPLPPSVLPVSGRIAQSREKYFAMPAKKQLSKKKKKQEN